MTAATIKEFSIWTSERSFRYKEEALHNHAPQTPGVYMLVTFDEKQNGKTLFMADVQDSTIFKVLFEHWEGTRQPAVKDLLAKYANLYFMYVAQSDAATPEDKQDLFWALMQQEKPALMDMSTVKPTGRYADIKVKDKSLL